ncbi:unnamed protein product [Clonostachys rhizophaga]|uniref:Acyltransferase MbtK/IucB-like conserved domain-containing protein n=1 Tax=Clonostachys rhizophaga TaxID=160324 RepID=A0A9N9UYA8_9HYPO|nr:unnamed protein product [Clonostachys rhizophaga]
MPQQLLHLPDGQTFTVTPVFGGVGFRSHEMNAAHYHAFPIGWTIVLQTEAEAESDDDDPMDKDDQNGLDERDGMLGALLNTKRAIRSYTTPTLDRDRLFISSIANPSSNEFKPAASPTRQIAMMLWVTLYWYFHQPEPSPVLETDASRLTPPCGKPRGDWKINITREGVLRGRNLIPKLERMGLIATSNSSVGTSLDDNGESWARMFVSRRMFWQIPGRLFLFTLQPNRGMSSFPGSPTNSRPSSPTPTDSSRPHHRHTHSQPPNAFHSRGDSDLPGSPTPVALVGNPGAMSGPFASSSHLPTYYPPPPPLYISTNGVRHPLRPKPPRMGEVFYSRYLPSVGQYLSFRVASNSPKPVPYLGPVGQKAAENQHLTTLSDTSLLQMWMSNSRVSAFWGQYHQNFLTDAFQSRHSFPVIGMWDGVPFGYFEIYWVKEDILGRQLGNESQDWDRGLHVLVGEEWARGRVPTWLNGLVHWCLTADYRTMNICLEPRVDNERFIERLQQNGFSRQRQVSFPHKQSWYVKLSRDSWEGPVL